MSGTSFNSLSIGTGGSVIKSDWEGYPTISKSVRDEAGEMKQKVVMKKVEKRFKWRRGESKDESRDTSPHVPYLTLIGQSLEMERNQGSQQSVDRGLVGIECHVVWLVLEVAPACEGNNILLLLDWNRELSRPYQNQNFSDFLKVSKGEREDPTPS